MQLKTILNRVQKHRSFVYGRIRWDEAGGEPVVRAQILARANSRPRCGGCGRPGPTYDTQRSRS
jgi:transposase